MAEAELRPSSDAPRRRAHGPQSHYGWRRYAEAALATTLCALLAWLLAPSVDTGNLGLVFLTGVLVSAVRGGVGPALFASGLSFLIFNYFLTEPRYTFYVSSRRDVLTLTFFLIVSLVTGQLAARVRRQLETIRAHSRRMVSLEDFSRRLTGIVGREDFARVLVDYLRSTLAVDAVVAFANLDGKLTVAAGDAGPAGLSTLEQAAATWAYQHKEAAGRGTGTLPRSVWYFLPLLGRGGSLGVMGVRLDDAGRGLDAERRSLLVAMRNQAGTALEKFQLASEMERSRLLTETDKLRASLLSSVSHDLRTPLVSIKGATTALLDFADSLSPADKRALLENVLDETDRLNRYVQNLLDMTRLGYGTLLPNQDWCDIRDIVSAARRTLKSTLESHSVELHVGEGEELVYTDAALLERVIANLLENAAKFSPAHTVIEIACGRDRAEYKLSVCDRGPGIPPAERDKVFDLFHRARTADQRTAGTGMGLAICKGLIEALGGQIRVSTRTGDGSCIEIGLPQPSEPPLDEPDE